LNIIQSEVNFTVWLDLHCTNYVI